MDFKHRPTFAFATHALIEMAGDGRWRGVDADGVETAYSDDEVGRAVAVATDGEGRGLYAIPDEARMGENRRFIIDRDKGVVHIEGAARALPVDEFMKCAVRTDRDGKPVCSFLHPLHEQYALCRGAKGGEAHCMDVADEAEAIRNTGKVGDMVNAGLYDAVASGLSDGMGFMDLMARVTARGGRPVHERFGLGEALPGHWAEIREFPQYMIDGVRALFGNYMDGLIGEFPLERISRLHAPPGAPVAELLDGIADFVAADEPFDGGNVIRGYRTSPVARYRGEGFEAIVFSDMAGTYAYAWPLTAKPDEANAPGMGG